MQKFVYQPERILRFRRAQLKTEESKLEELRRQQRAAHDAILRGEQYVADLSGYITGQPRLSHSDIGTFGAYRARVARQREDLAAQLKQLNERVVQQEAAVEAARIAARLFENLRERRYSEWTADHNRELEQASAEFATAKWLREAGRQT